MDEPAVHRDAIRDLLARYTYNGDRGRVAELAACFAADGMLEFPGASPVGPGAIEAALSSGTRSSKLTFVRHHITNPLIDIDDGAATARSYFAVHSNIGLDHSGTYDDRLIHNTDGWRFAHRRVRIDWQADASLFRRMTSR